MKTKITIKDIANELGISTSTVSRALKDNPKISKETRERVQAFADLYNYKPNTLALKLRNNKTMTIGIIIPEIVHHFFSKVISGVEKIANEKDYNVMVCLSNESYEKEVLNMQMMVDGNVDGLLVSIAKETLEKQDFSHFEALDDYGIPLVLFDRVTDKIACDKVIVDDIGAGYKATQHLIDIGCKRIALLATPDHVNVGALRKIGYEKAFADNLLNLDRSKIIRVNEMSDIDIKEQIESLFNIEEERPDGIVAVNEIYAAHATKIAMEKGMMVPQEIAIIGFTDGLISQFSTPSLSTIVQHGFTMGEIAGDLLLSRIETDSNEPIDYEKKVISTNIKVRNSTLNYKRE
ncbi:MAG: LacI family DNA-binding transcriptional regulator [Flavobacteriaceae bacterium]|nr:LacI family DNA-binding transcriptional regulator [Flavobacteriaceae bacterium]